jgi:VanZ family protein
MISISILSGSAGIQTKGWSFTGMDKLGHFVIFGLLGMAWVRCLDEGLISRGRRFAYAVTLTVAFGLIDELHQYHNPLRTFEWADLLADFIGSVVATAIYLRTSWIRRILETEIDQSLRLPFAVKKPDSSS